MKFSAENEDLLKRFFTATENREKMAYETRERAHTLTNELVGAVESEYSTLMDACGVLEDLWERTTKLKEVNESTSKLAKGLLKDAIDNMKQEKELIRCNERITNIQKELSRIEEYVRHKNEADKLLRFIETDTSGENGGSTEENDGGPRNSWFHFTKALVKMDEIVGLFKKYYFFGLFFEELAKIKQKITNIAIKNIERFLNQNWALLGKRIEVSRDFKIFDDLKVRKKDVYDELTYETFYCIKKFPYMQPVIKKVITAKRCKMFEDATKLYKNDPDTAVCFYIGNIFLSYLLSEIFPSIDTFYPLMFTGLRSLPSYKIELISKLRLVVEKLKISTVELDSTVENIVYKYFERELESKKLVKLSNKEIIEKVLQSHGFLQAINSYDGEFDEIFLRNLDDALIYAIENAPFDHFFERMDGIEDIITKLRDKDPYIKDYSFECLRDGKRQISKIAEKQVNELQEFGLKNTTENIVKKIISYKEIKNRDFKSKFVEILKAKIDKIFEGKTKEDKALFLDTAKRNLG